MLSRTRPATLRLLAPVLAALVLGTEIAAGQTVPGEHVRKFFGAVHLGADEEGS